MKAKIILALKSRTFWTVVFTFLINGLNAVRTFVPPHWMPLVDGVLGITTIYFHLNPSQTY